MGLLFIECCSQFAFWNETASRKREWEVGIPESRCSPRAGGVFTDCVYPLSAALLSGHWHERSPIKVGFLSVRRQVLLGWLYQKIQSRCDQWGGLGDISVNLGPDEILSFAPTMKLFPLHLPQMGLSLFFFE